MNLAEWRAKQRAGELLMLPSGLEVTARRVELIDLIAEGEIPETLDALVKRATTEGFGVKDVAEFMPLVNVVVRICLLKPAVGDTEDDDHVLLKEIPVTDRMFLFQWANGAATTLAPFPVQPAVALADAPGGDHVWSEAEHPA